MSRVIWKFTVDPWQNKMPMPKGAKLLHVHEQGGHVCVWAEVDPVAADVERIVLVSGTGHPVPRLPDVTTNYVGTAHINEAGTPLVLHVYDGGEVDTAAECSCPDGCLCTACPRCGAKRAR